MARRVLYLLVILGGSLFPFLARAAQNPVNVVKIISFDCAICRASNDMDGPIKSTVEQYGGIFDIAPIPRVDTDWRERFYYVLRQYGPSVEKQVRDSFFAGSQEYNYPLMDIPEILDWLEENTRLPGVNWNSVLQQVKSPQSLKPINRAVALVAKAGVRMTPTYILIRNGRVLNAYDIDSVPNENLSSLRETVLNAVIKADSNPPQR